MRSSAKPPAARSLSDLLIDLYAPLRERLSRRTGSADLSVEALHETWIKLQDGRRIPEDAGEAYLYRTLVNTATDITRARRRHIGHEDIEKMLDLTDDAPDQERFVAARQEVRTLRKALAQLPRRQAEIFQAFFGQEATVSELSQIHGVSVRTIEIDLRKAVLHCARMNERHDLAEPGILRVSARKRR